MRRLLTLAVLAVCLGASSASPSGARAATPVPQQAATTADHVAHVAHNNAIGGLPIAVDGAKNPDRIPMDLAYRHFIRAISGTRDKDGEPADITERRRGHLSRMGLSDDDKAALEAAVSDVGDGLRGVELARRRGAPVDLAALRLQEREILDSARERIGLALSADGAGRLDEYVQTHVRSRITIYGELPQ